MISNRSKPAPLSPLVLRHTGLRMTSNGARKPHRVFGWFLGKNDLQVPLYDATTGGCRDGLHPDRVNENQGAESTLSFLMALLDMRASNWNKRRRNVSGNECLLLNPIIAPVPLNGSTILEAQDRKLQRSTPFHTLRSEPDSQQGALALSDQQCVQRRSRPACRRRHVAALSR